MGRSTNFLPSLNTRCAEEHIDTLKAIRCFRSATDSVIRRLRTKIFVLPERSQRDVMWRSRLIFRIQESTEGTRWLRFIFRMWAHPYPCPSVHSQDFTSSISSLVKL